MGQPHRSQQAPVQQRPPALARRRWKVVTMPGDPRWGSFPAIAAGSSSRNQDGAHRIHLSFVLLRASRWYRARSRHMARMNKLKRLGARIP